MTRLKIGKSTRIAAMSGLRSDVVRRPSETVMSGPRTSRLGEAYVTGLFEFVGQFRTTRFDDSTADEDVHEFRMDVTQNPGVVRNQQDSTVLGLGITVDTLADHAQRVDIQAGVGLVEDRDLGLQQPQLQNFVALF